MAVTYRFFVAVLACALVILPLQAGAAEGDADIKVFKLQRGSASIEDELDLEMWVPGIEQGTIELSLTLGFMNLATTLLQHDQMIYKYTTENTYWGDVEISGESAFNPTAHLGYNLTPWLTLGGSGGLSISEYSSSVSNRRVRKNEEGAPVFEDPALGEYDLEARSLITLQAGVNAMVYPFNFDGDGSGRLQPFLMGNAGTIWYEMNSDFTEGGSTAADFGLGGGIRILADRNISIRLDAVYHINSVEFTPADYFAERDEGTLLVPLNEYPIRPDGDGFDERPVEAFSSNDVNYLAWSIGVHGSF